MINWFEVALMKKRYENFCKKETEDLTEEDIVICNLDRGRLIYLLNKFRPRPFDPEDRGTWPEAGKFVFFKDNIGIWYCGFIGDLGTWYDQHNFPLNNSMIVTLWQPLPPVGKEGEG